MKSGKNLQPTEDFSEEVEAKNTLSIDEFFKQLESKERDLDISSEMIIEIEETDIDGELFPGFLNPIEPASGNEEYIPGYLDSNPAANGKDKAEKANTKERQQGNAQAKLENKISLLQKQISKMEAERAGLLEISRRRQTDFENYKKRIERERNETRLNQISNLAIQMLPVLDNLNRALDAASNLSSEKVLDSQEFFDGIVLVNQQLEEVLSEMGVSRIVSVGEPFDPHLHEAVATEQTGEMPPHTITAELLQGFRIGERVIRPSMVRVSTGENSG